MNPNPYQPVQQELLAYLRLLATHSEPGQFFDVRWMTVTGGMRQRFIPAQRIMQGALLITRLAPQTDVYVGVALRNGRTHGGKRAINGSRVLYIECDHPDSRARLEDFECAPSMIVSSGSPGHLHVYWSLQHLADGSQVESTNRRLALSLGGDPASVDLARVLRPPTTMNHKHSPPLPVQLITHNPNTRYELATITAALPTDPQSVRPSTSRAASHRRLGLSAVDNALLAIPAAEYVRVLADRKPNHAGKVLCPFHEETHPSLHLYPDGTFYCYGRRCRKGGTIFDFAAALWGLGTKDNDFLELRRRLASVFALTHTSDSGS